MAGRRLSRRLTFAPILDRFARLSGLASVVVGLAVAAAHGVDIQGARRVVGDFDTLSFLIRLAAVPLLEKAVFFGGAVPVVPAIGRVARPKVLDAHL